jgi:hypothetical protein
MNRQRSTRASATLRDLKLIVRPPGQPQEIRVFTAAERAEAELFAAETGAAVGVLL